MSRTAVLVACGGIIWELLRTTSPSVMAAWEHNDTANASATSARPEREPMPGEGYRPPPPRPDVDSSNASGNSSLWEQWVDQAAAAGNRTRAWWTAMSGAFTGTPQPSAPQAAWSWDSAPLVFFEFLVSAGHYLETLGIRYVPVSLALSGLQPFFSQWCWLITCLRSPGQLSLLPWPSSAQWYGFSAVW